MKFQEFKTKLFSGKYDRIDLTSSLKLSTLDFFELLKIEKWFDKDLKAYKGLFQRSLLGVNNLPKLYSELNQGQAHYFSGSLQKELNWQVLGFIKFTKEINKFLFLRNKFEYNLLSGKYSEAREILDEIESTICVSFWEIENRLILDDRQFGSESNWATRNTMVGDKNHLNVRACSDFYSIKAESKYSFFQFNEYFNNWIDFLSKSNHTLSPEAEEYFRFKANYFSHENYEHLAYICFQESSASLIDRYIMFVRIVQHAIIRSEIEISFLEPLISFLGKEIVDPQLNNLMFSRFNKALYLENSTEVIDTIDMYSTGNYEECIKASSTLLLNGYLNHLELLLILVKSCIESGSAIPKLSYETSLISQIADILFNILSKNENTEASFIDLIKLSYVFNNSRYGLFFYAFVSEQFWWETEIDYAQLSRLNSYFINPALAYSMYKNKETVEIFLKNISYLHPKSTTVKIFKEFVNSINKHINSEIENIPVVKAKVYRGRSLMLSEKFEESILIYNDILKNGDFSKITEYESLSSLYYCYFLTKDFHNCLKIFTEAYLVNSELTTRMNTEKLISEISLGKFKNIKLDKDLIDLPIFFKINCKDKIRVKQSYELFLKANGVSKPSELKESKELDSDGKLVYFLKSVCIPDILQLSKTFISSYSVNEERIKICQWLVILDEKNISIYNQEIAAITQRNAISKVIGRIDEGKIYVNEDKIKQIFLRSESRADVSKLNTSQIEKHLSRDFFNRTRDLQKFMENNEYKDVSNILYMDYDEEGNLSLKGNPVFVAFKQMFLEVRDHFVTNNEYGLNPFLSTRIRHGTLPNHIRSVFERLNLVTSQTDGVYSNNEFWEEKLQLNADENSKIQSLLANFSKVIDEISANLKDNSIQYKTENKVDKPEALFDYEYKQDTDLLRLYLTKFKTFEEFIEFCFDELWERTEKCLEIIRTLLNTDIKQKFTDLITELEQDIESCSDKSKTYELITNINLARTEIQILLTNIAKWFFRSESSFDGEYELSMLSETSIQIIKNVNPYYNFLISAEVLNNIDIKGEYHEYFIDIIRNFLENMIKRSNLSMNELTPTLKIDGESGTLKMHFGNNISANIEKNVLISKMQAIKDNWSSLDANISLEDGTGFSKIKKALHSDLERKATTFNYKLNGNRLEIDLEFETGGLIA